VSVTRKLQQANAVLARVSASSDELAERRARVLATEISSVLEASAVGKGREYAFEWRTNRRTGQAFETTTPRKNTHKASAPGDPPARDTGTLLNSIQWRKRERGVWEIGPARESFTNRPGNTASRYPYPVELEFGSRAIAPRPFMRPALERFKRDTK
jgi:hypothetical protein